MKAQIAILALLSTAVWVRAQSTVPLLMSYQGRVTDSAGVAIGSTAAVNRAVIFRLYSVSTGGTATYNETQSVTISGGEFSVLIGNGTGLTGLPGPTSPASPIKTLDAVINTATTSALYLGITVDDGSAATVDAEISPRQQLVTGAFALRARMAESVASGAVTSAMLGASSVTTNQLAASSITSAKIADASIAAADIASSAITSSKIDTATVGIWTPSGNNIYRNSNVGIGTSNPAYKLSIQDGQMWFTTASGNGDNGGIGGVMAANDSFRIFGAGDNNNGALYIDTGDDGNEPIIFRQSGKERMRLNSDGKVGVGTTNTGSGHVNAAGAFDSVGSRNGSEGHARMYYDGGTGSAMFEVYNGGQSGLQWRGFRYDGDSNLDYYSDLRLKTDVVPAEPMLDRLMQLPFHRFRWKDNSDADQKHQFGVIAQEVEPLFPDLIAKGTDGFLTVGYGTFATIACKAIQELKVREDAERADVQNQLDDKDRKIADLEARLDALEKRISGTE